MVVKGSKNTYSTDESWLGRELGGLIAIFLGLLLTLSLATFDIRDPWLNQIIHSKTHKIYNKAGLFGSYTGGFLFDFMGFAAWVVPVYFCFIGIRRIISATPWPWWRWSGFVLLALCVAVGGAATDMATSHHGGGLLGYAICKELLQWLGESGAFLTWILVLLLSLQMLAGFSWLRLCGQSLTRLWKTWQQLSPSSSSVQDALSDGFSLSQEEATQELSAQRPKKSTSHRLFSSWFTRKGTTAKKSVELAMPAIQQTSIAHPQEPDIFSHELFSETVTEHEVIPQERDYEYSQKYRTVSDEDRTVIEPESGTEILSDVIEDEEEEDSAFVFHSQEPEPIYSESIHEKTVARPSEPVAPRVTRKKALVPLPSLSLLEAIATAKVATNKAVLEEKGKNLMTCLTDFGIQCELVGITPGPVVTMFELRPAPGVRVSRIANLSDDLALALKSVAVRVQAPIPGTDTVGIEIPNDEREIVCCKELFQAKAFQQSSMKLPLALGKDIAGRPFVADLASMPHLLVAGATGAGKSVGINSILLSLLYKARPEEVKLLLVDPKRVEMAIYADLPHLVHPVVTEMSMAKNALDWAVAEMDLRYQALAKAGVRNIGDYNTKLASYQNKELPEQLIGLEAMPYLVIVIDELADLMLTGAKDVETSIVRLAQLARAAGIHLILATQRPSVDVVTGLIKANFPCRIAFQVTSKHDSRTILDAVGAEYLLGKGDMLFKPSGGRFLRLHGAFVSDKNVLAVCDYWRYKQKPEYRVDFAEWHTEDGGNSVGGSGGEDFSTDPLYTEACEFVRQQGKVSISLIQRRFRIGFNKAARYVEQMEYDGIVSPADGSRPRQVIG